MYLLSLGLSRDGNGLQLNGFKQESGDVSVGHTDQTTDKREAGMDTD